MDVSVIGVPFNSDGTSLGVARMPAALRRHGLVRRLRDVGPSVCDAGDVTVDVADTRRDAATGIVAVEAVAGVAGRVRERVAAVLRDRGFPLVVAGECSVVIGALAALRGECGAAGLLFVDGHEDTWPSHASPTGDVADMELGLALGRHLPDLPEPLRGMLPVLRPDDVVLLGPRDRGEMEAAGVGSLRDELWLVDAEQLRDRLGDVVTGAVAHLDRTSPAWWLHVDLDVLSTAALPAVDAPQPGGLEWDELGELTRIALGGSRVRGMDVTIFDPDLDPSGAYAERIVEYLAAAFARG